VLKSVDVLIGLTVIMLALSMTVTVLTQFVTTVLNTRGRYLRKGLVDLLTQIDPALTNTVATTVAEKVLTSPLVCATWGRLGSVIHREEFTKLLMHFATDTGGRVFGEDADTRTALKNALVNNDVKDPRQMLENVRKAALQLEIANPELPSDVRQTKAMLQEAGVDLVGKVNGWFDQTMDRVSQRFTASTRAIVFGGGVLVAVGLQVDTIQLVNRLAADDKLRAAFVTQGQKLAEDNSPAPGKDAAESADARERIDREYLAFLAENGLITIPRPGEWLRRWSEVNPFGVAITAFLLSLGAPFWYGALGKLLQLRSVLARKDDEQRAARQGVESGSPGRA
jgi:hypothetical protein